MGIGNAHTRSASTITLGKPTITKGLDIAIVRRYIKRSLDRFSYCYEKELLARPGLRGTVAATFLIAPNGQVSNSIATGLPVVDHCVADVIGTMEFPKPQGDAAVKVTYPITFAPPPR